MFTTSNVMRLQYSLFDSFLAMLAIGFYSPSWKFELESIHNYVFFGQPYDWLTSPFDYVALSLVRLFLMIFGTGFLFLKKTDTIKILKRPILIFFLFNYAYSLAKLLVLCENESVTSYPGLWISPVWCIISSIIFYNQWSKMSDQKFESYETLTNVSDASIPNGTTHIHSEEIPSETTSEEEEEKYELRLNTLHHMWLLIKLCKDEWLWFTIGWTFLVLYTIAKIYIPSLTGQVINDVVNGRGFDVLVKSVITMGGVSAACALFGGIRGGSFDYATGRLYRQVRSKLFRSLVTQDIAFYDVTKSGDMQSRLAHDTYSMSGVIAEHLNVFLRSSFMLIGAMFFTFTYSWRLAMITFIGIPPIFYVVKIYGTYFDELSEKIQDTTSEANQVAQEVLSTIRTVRSFASEERVANKFDHMLDNTLSGTKSRSRAYIGYILVHELWDNFIMIVVLLYGGHLVITDKMSSEYLVTFMLYQLQIADNLYSIFYEFTSLMESVGASRKVMKLMMRQTEIPNDGLLKPPVSGEIKLTDVHFTYPTRPNNPILKGLDLTITAGTTVALVGPSGGGKSSIVALIQHFYEPSKGSITLDGVPIRDISHEYYHQKIALVAQEPVLYCGSVRHNILYGCEWATEEDMMSAARMANVDEFVSKLDKGYDTDCGEKGVQMSGGQKQRIAIARALVRRPSVLILDEATSALDAESEALVQEAINNCSTERTVLIIAHRLSTIEKADKIAVIQGGSVIQLGSHQELMRQEDGMYRSLVSKQMLQPLKQD